MNILHITYDMRIGGTEMVIKNIIEGNRDNDIHMSIFCIEAPLGPWGEELKAKGVPVFTHERKPGFDVSLIRAIRQHIKTHNIDVVHCHQYTPWVYGALSSVLTKAKVIFTEHGRFYPDSSSWKRKLVNPVLVSLTRYITSISEATKHALVNFENISASRIQVIYNGIKPLSTDTEAANRLKQSLNLDNASVVFGTVARLDPIKNQIMMIKAFADVLQQMPQAKLLIVGDGEQRDALHALSEKLEITESIVFTGYIKHPAEHISTIDIFLLSSLSEGTSMTLLEAMSIGKPCIVTDAGGNGEVIQHNKTGYVVENNNQQSFAEAMLHLAQHKKTREQFGDAALLRWKDKFSCDVMSDQMSQLYKA